MLVEPERLPGWFDRFGQRHGGVASTEVAPHQVTVHAADGATAVVAVPFGPLDAMEGAERRVDGLAVDELVAHLLRPRRVALLRVRLGGHSTGAESG